MAYKSPTKSSSKRSSKKMSEYRSIPRIIGQKGPEVLFSPNSDIVNAIAELEINGYIEKNIYPQSSKTFEKTINGLGFSLSEISELSPGLQDAKQFSLIGSINADETIQNSKIIDPDLSMLTPVKHTTIDKFKSASDAFYTIDEERPRSIKNITQQQKNNKRKYRKIANGLSRIAKRSNNPILSKTNQRGRSK